MKLANDKASSAPVKMQDRCPKGLSSRRTVHTVPSMNTTGSHLIIASIVALALSACTADGAGEDAPDGPHAAFMANLAHHCGESFPGRLVREPPGDDMLTGTERLMVHFRACRPDEVRIPFHVEIEDEERWDRSRTWFVILHDDGLELRHDHRRPDGSESTRTWYGGFSVGAGTATRQDFESPERTRAAGVPVGWRIEIEPDVRYVYGTTYNGEYDWQIEFDLSRALDGPPPLPWGHDAEPSREPGPP
jgi:hypothetical protein